MKITATLTFTAAWANAMQKGPIPGGKEISDYARGVIKKSLSDFIGPVTHDREEWVAIRLASVKVRPARAK